MKRRERIIGIVLLAGILVLMSACSDGKKEQEIAEQTSGNETMVGQTSGNVTAVEQTAGNVTAVAQNSGNETVVEQPAGTVVIGEQTNSTQVSDAQPEGENQDASAGTQESGGAAPVITENPTDETLTEGYSCMYIAAADNADKAHWRAVSPDGKIDIPYADLELYFPYIEYVGINEEALSLFNIPADFDGWGSYCRFTNSAGSTDSAVAVTHVTPIPDDEPEQAEQQSVQTEQKDDQTEENPVQTEHKPIQAVAEE